MSTCDRYIFSSDRMFSLFSSLPRLAQSESCNTVEQNLDRGGLGTPKRASPRHGLPGMLTFHDLSTLLPCMPPKEGHLINVGAKECQLVGEVPVSNGLQAADSLTSSIGWIRPSRANMKNRQRGAQSSHIARAKRVQRHITPCNTLPSAS